MFSEEVQKVRERNATLEAENKHLYQTINELMTELTALKAANSKFKEDCQNFIESQTSNMLAPSKELTQKIYRQNREIEALKQQLIQSETKANNEINERERLYEEKKNLESTTRESEKISLENKKVCKEVLNSIIKLQDAMKNQMKSEIDINAEEEDSNDEITDGLSAQLSFSQQLRQIQQRFNSIQDQYSRTLDRSQGFMLEIAAKEHTIKDLETRISVMQKQIDAANETNQRYNQERDELQGSIDTLRKALNRMKEQYIKTDKERKELMEANQLLKDAINSTKKSFDADNEDGK